MICGGWLRNHKKGEKKITKALNIAGAGAKKNTSLPGMARRPAPGPGVHLRGSSPRIVY